MKLPNLDLRRVSKGIAGAVSGMVIGNGSTLTMSPEQIAAMPWWGILVANVIYAAIGFATVFFAPQNSTPGTAPTA